VLDDLSTGLSSNIEGSHCDFIDGSILDSNLLTEIAAGVDHIVHLAAIGSVPRSISSPRPTHEANITGTLNVLEAARQNSVAHVIVASSSSVYGSNPNLPRSEFDWTRPLSPYAVSKLATEAYANAYASSYGMKTVAFRFFNVFGPRQRADHPYAAVIPKFVSAALANTPLTIHGDGTQTRDFTFVESVCNALHTTISESLHFEHPVNLAFGSRVSLLEVVGKLELLLKKKLDVEHTETRPGDVRASQAETSLLHELIPSATNFDFEAGLQKTIEWFQSDSSALL
jgi:UDP-glucose 4-epimerase